ncbi:MAG: helix-turn-helix transcriptional regulator [Acidobacteria bacterium]|nr:helix-turn-helix transcriptional regulator [Acidobacteriota bacterium]
MRPSARSRDRLLTLIASLYEAPGSLDRWQMFLQSLAVSLDGTAASFISHDLVAQRGSVALTLADPSATREYLDHWIAMDPWAHSPKARALTEGRVVVGEEIVSRSELRRTAFFNDFSSRYGIGQSIVSILESGPGALSGLSINRSDTCRPFDGGDVALLEALMPHLRRALQLHRRIATAEAISEDLTGVLDSATRAVFLVDEAGRVTWMNRVAERLIATRDGLVVDEGALRAVRGADAGRLRTLLAECIDTSAGNGIGPGGAVLLGRPSGRRPLMALVAPLTRRLAFFANPHAPVAVVVVSDPESVTVPDEATLRELFGLTPAEARLTRLLVQGATLADAATRLDLHIETVRTRLKGIFEKTDTHRQSDLVRLVLLGRPTL